MYSLTFKISHTTIEILFFSYQLGRKKINCDCNFNEAEFTLFPGCLPICYLGKLTQMQLNHSVFFFFHQKFSCQDQMKGNNIPLVDLHTILESVPNFNEQEPAGVF
jgi:hypothetical protein